MPFSSESQRRYFHWAASKGKISPKVVKEWESVTHTKKLPEQVKKEGAMDKYSAAEKIVKATSAGRALAKRVAIGLGIGTGALGVGAGGYAIGAKKTEKKMEKYPRVLARLAGMAARPGGIHMVATPQYYKDEAGNVKRKIGVRVTSGS